MSIFAAALDNWMDWLQDESGNRYLVMPSAEPVTKGAKSQAALKEYMDQQVGSYVGR